MRLLSLSVILLTLAAAPVNAGMVSSEELDQRGQCGVRSARMIVDGPEDSVVFPDDSKQCQGGDGDTGSDSRFEARPAPASDASDNERKLDLANLPVQQSIPSLR